METKLTKKQRHKIYKNALGLLPNHYSGLCALFENMSNYDIWTYDYWEYENKNLSYSKGEINQVTLPELALFSESCYWDFTGYDANVVRKTVLKFCIEMTR